MFNYVVVKATSERRRDKTDSSQEIAKMKKETQKKLFQDLFIFFLQETKIEAASRRFETKHFLQHFFILSGFSPPQKSDQFSHLAKLKQRVN